MLVDYNNDSKKVELIIEYVGDILFTPYFPILMKSEIDVCSSWSLIYFKDGHKQYFFIKIT